MWEWLGEALAVDYANTTKRRGRDDTELLTSGENLAAWAEREDDRVPRVSARAAAARLGEVRLVRDDVQAVLHAAVDGRPAPRAAAEHLNDRARAVPLVAQLRGREVALEPAAPADPLDELLARVAASAIELAGHGGAALGFCDAPSCGQFFERGRGNQRWCSDACGTRARVARHAAHRRGGTSAGVPDDAGPSQGS
jgi:predicted RNA-binding Zn ribbon-like protein